MNKQQIVLDTSAFLALVHREAGHEQVVECLSDNEGVMSSVNLAEVLSKQTEFGIPPREALSLFHLTGIRIIDFGSVEALQTGLLRPITKILGLSLGDRACLALGLILSCPVLTADRAWEQLDIQVQIQLIR
jgi:ribonuclease VapC